VGVLLLLLLLPACPDEGSGATYPAAALYRFDGAELTEGEFDPRAGVQLADGSPQQGHAWSVVVADGDLWVGAPDAGEVWRWAGGTGEAEVVASGAAADAFGAAIAVLDGEPFVGAPDASAGAERAGAGALWLGGDEARRVVGRAPQQHLGAVVAGCGDIDGDGADDVAVAVPWADELAGAVYVLAADSAAGSIAERTPVGSGLAGDGRGSALACAHDLLGGPDPDLVIGARFAAGAAGGDGEGAVEVWDAEALAAGSPAAKLFAHEADDADAAEPAAFGSALVGCALRSSGRPALVVGAPMAAGGLGAVYVFFPGEGLDDDARPAVEIVGDAADARFGAAVACADDDGDGVDELYVGAPGENAPDGTAEAGALYAFDGLGAASGTFRPAQATRRFFSDRAYLRTGERFAVGDLDGDGRAEVVLLVRQR
jgi:hypothetical protein